MRKPRADSKLDYLTPEQEATLTEWLLDDRLPYHKVIPLLKKEFQVSTSLGSLSKFWESHISAELLARRQRAVSTAQYCADEAQKKPGKFDQATIDALKQRVFVLSQSGTAAAGEIKSLFSLLLKSRDQELKSKDIEIKMRRLELAEQQLDKVKSALTDGSASITQREARMKEIFGL